VIFEAISGAIFEKLSEAPHAEAEQEEEAPGFGAVAAEPEEVRPVAWVVVQEEQGQHALGTVRFSVQRSV